MNQAQQSPETGPSPGSASARAEPAVPAMAVLLAACAGATDALAFFGLGKAFAGIVTGNLVTAGYGIATGNSSLVKPTVTAVAGSVVGEIIWARLAVTTAAVLAQHLVVLLDPADLVENIHLAYRHPSFADSAYAVLLSGPSGSADIGGVTVHPAQGVTTMTIILWPRAEGALCDTKSRVQAFRACVSDQCR